MKIARLIIFILIMMLIPLVFWVYYADPGETPLEYTASTVTDYLKVDFENFDHLSYKKEASAVRAGENVKPEPRKDGELTPPVPTGITKNFNTIEESEIES